MLYAQYFVQPDRAFKELLHYKLELDWQYSWCSFQAGGYTNMDLYGWLAGGALSTCKSWLAIPIDQYVSA